MCNMFEKGKFMQQHVVIIIPINIKRGFIGFSGVDNESLSFSQSRES